MQIDASVGITLAVLALLCLRRRRTGLSYEARADAEVLRDIEQWREGR